jgi:hypothetical protein
MCDRLSSLLILGFALSTAVAHPAHAEEFDAGKACSLLSRDLFMRIETPAGRKALESSELDEDWVGEAQREAGMTVERNVSSCKYGRVLLVLDPLARPDPVRSAMNARTSPYQKYESVPGVGDAAFFEANSTYANLYVWTGGRHFHIEIGVGFMDGDDTKALKPNTIESWRDQPQLPERMMAFRFSQLSHLSTEDGGRAALRQRVLTPSRQRWQLRRRRRWRRGWA